MRSIFVILLTLWPLVSQAKESLNADGQPLSSADWLSWILSMVVVLIAIGICAWLAKKTRFNAFGNGQMKVIANLTLGTRERVIVVQVGQTQYLLGVTNQHIELIDKLAEPLQGDSQAPSFAKQLNRILKGNGR
ncbi:flagellar biosynthetic protein FliO [Celerinatantimonas sp. MCCC 1A17872]|uniref:flagellar biosynthetic protein FliO n=1 Tax=Celerinatantimonas sp. MCCC 1A17872 TaxID=3177514 RepID=UPI0038C1A2A4